MLVDMWEGNEKFRQQVLDELIKDCIHVEVAGIASATLAVNILYYCIIDYIYTHLIARLALRVLTNTKLNLVLSNNTWMHRNTGQKITRRLSFTPGWR